MHLKLKYFKELSQGYDLQSQALTKRLPYFQAM